MNVDVLDVGVGLGERLVQSTIQIQGDILEVNLSNL